MRWLVVNVFYVIHVRPLLQRDVLLQWSTLARGVACRVGMLYQASLASFWSARNPFAIGVFCFRDLLLGTDLSFGSILVSFLPTLAYLLQVDASCGAWLIHIVVGTSLSSMFSGKYWTIMMCISPSAELFLVPRHIQIAWSASSQRQWFAVTKH